MINIPTISQLYYGIISDLETEFSISIPVFGKNYFRIKAAVQSVKLKLFYLSVANLQKNIFIDTAEPESMGGTLERFGRIKLNRNPFPARAAQYKLEVTGTIGATIAASSTFKSNDDSLNPGMLYVLDQAYTLVAITDYITVRALTAGLDSSLNNLDKLTSTAPIANVNSGVSVNATIIEPLAAEDIEAYRTAGINSYRLEPQGGAGTDYILWASDAQGVAKTYPYAKSGVSNEINLFVEATLADSTDGKGTPSGALLTAVEADIELSPDVTQPILERGRRPLGVHQVHYLAVTIKEVNISIASFVGLTADIQASIQTAIDAAISGIRPFIASSDVLANKNDILDKNRIIGIILNANPGSVFGAITLNVAGVDVNSYTFINGDIPHSNTVTYV